MATFTWTAGTTGDWNVASEWTLTGGTGTAPPGSGEAATDVATLPSGTVEYTVAVNSSESFDIATLNIFGLSPVDSTTLSISGAFFTNTLDYSGGTSADGMDAFVEVNSGGLFNIRTNIVAPHPEDITNTGGTVVLGDASNLGIEINSTNVTFSFNDTAGGVIEFDGPVFTVGSTANQVITGATAGDSLVFDDGATFTDDTFTYSGTTLTVMSGGTTIVTMTDLTGQTSLDAADFEAVGDTIEIACFAAGTQIRTPDGEEAIEELVIGDLVVTLHNEAKPIRWIGRRAYDARFVASNRALQPILIRQDALDDGVPRRDLYVSSKHALFLDDVLVPAERLVNGTSIVRCDAVATLEYFHIELDTHDIILAEGAPSETFVDCDNRGMFQNAHEFARLYPDHDAPTWAFCAPRIEEGDVLQYLRWRLDERLEAFGCTTTFDPDLHLVVDGVPVSAGRVDGTVHVFRLDRPAREVRIVSRTSVPVELDVASTDIRRLGVNVSRVKLRSNDVDIVVGCRDTSLVDGFHASEGTHRWTDGDARIPAKFLGCFDKNVTIEVHVQNHKLSYRTGQWGAERFAATAAAGARGCVG